MHFNKLEKMEKSNRLADQDTKAAVFLFYPICLDFKLYLQIFRQIQSENLVAIFQTSIYLLENRTIRLTEIIK